MGYDTLTGGYKAIYDRAAGYGSYIDLDPDFLNECLTDLQDMLLTAQEHNTPLKKIIGESEEEFCRSYFSAYSTKDKAHALLRINRGTLWMLLPISLLSMVVARLDGYAITTATIGKIMTVCVVFDLVFLVVYHILFINWVQSRYFKIRNVDKVINRVSFAVFCAGLVLGVIYQDCFGAMPAIPVAILSGIYAFGYCIPCAIQNHRRTGHFRRQTVRLAIKQHEKYEKRRSLEMAFVHEMEGILERKNTRRAQKDEQPITKEAHMLQFQKQNRRLPWMLCGLVLLFVALIALEWLVLGLNPFLWLIDAGYLGFCIAFFLAWRARLRIERACVEQGIAVLDYQG